MPLFAFDEFWKSTLTNANFDQLRHITTQMFIQWNFVYLCIFSFLGENRQNYDFNKKWQLCTTISSFACLFPVAKHWCTQLNWNSRFTTATNSKMWQVRPPTLCYPHQSCHMGWGLGRSFIKIGSGVLAPWRVEICHFPMFSAMAYRTG